MSKLYFLSFLILLTINLAGQGPLNEIWSNSLLNDAGASLEDLTTVHAHANGHIVAGKSSSPLGFDMYVASYDNAGQLQWQAYIDTPNNGTITHIVPDGTGDYYLMGYEILSQFYERYVHLAKISSTGDILWHTVYAGPEDINAWGKDISLGNGRLQICGSEDRPDGFDSGFVAQFDLDGNLLWHDDFNPGIGNDLISLTTSPNGNVTAVGYAEGGNSLYAIQYDENGSVNWTFPDVFEFGDEIEFSYITSDEAGNLYTQVTEETGFFEKSVITQKRNDDFSIVWENTFNNGEENEGRSIELGAGGTVYSFMAEEDNFDYLGRAVKLSSTGEELFSVSDEIGNGTLFEKGVLGENEQIILALRNLNNFGVTTFSSAGDMMQSTLYDVSQIDYVTDISAHGDQIILVGREALSENSMILSLDSDGLAENYATVTTGTPMPDARPGKILSQGADLWLSLYGQSGNDATYSIVKLNASGEVDWEFNLARDAVYPDFIDLAADEQGNVIGLYQSGQSVFAGHYGLVKVDSDGNEVFSIDVDDNPNYKAAALAVDASENILVTGYIDLDYMMFLEKYDPSGSLLWHVEYQSPASSFPVAEPLGMLISPQGKIVIAAEHRAATGDTDFHLFQYDANGTMEWNSVVAEQTGNQVTLGGMEVKDNGDIVVLGSSGSSFVGAEYNASGAQNWSYQVSGSNPYGLSSFTRDAAGNNYLCMAQGGDARIVKLGPNGNLLAETLVNSSSSGAFHYPEHCAFFNGTLVVQGDHLMYQYGTVRFEAALNSDLEVVQLNIDSTQTAQIHTTSLNDEGELYTAYLTGAIALGQGSRSAIVRKFTIDAVGIEEQVLDQSLMKIFPNPSQGVIYIDLKSLDHRHIEVITLRDIKGRVIKEYSPSAAADRSSLIEIQLPPSLESGVYLVELTYGSSRLTSRLMIQ